MWPVPWYGAAHEATSRYWWKISANVYGCSSNKWIATKGKQTHSKQHKTAGNNKTNLINATKLPLNTRHILRACVHVFSLTVAGFRFIGSMLFKMHKNVAREIACSEMSTIVVVRARHWHYFGRYTVMLIIPVTFSFSTWYCYWASSFFF